MDNDYEPALRQIARHKNYIGLEPIFKEKLHIALFGPPQSGKTSFIKQLVKNSSSIEMDHMVEQGTSTTKQFTTYKHNNVHQSLPGQVFIPFREPYQNLMITELSYTEDVENNLKEFFNDQPRFCKPMDFTIETINNEFKTLNNDNRIDIVFIFYSLGSKEDPLRDFFRCAESIFLWPHPMLPDIILIESGNNLKWDASNKSMVQPKNYEYSQLGLKESLNKLYTKDGIKINIKIPKIYLYHSGNVHPDRFGAQWKDILIEHRKDFVGTLNNYILYVLTTLHEKRRVDFKILKSKVENNYKSQYDKYENILTDGTEAIFNSNDPSKFSELREILYSNSKRFINVCLSKLNKIPGFEENYEIDEKRELLNRSSSMTSIRKWVKTFKFFSPKLDLKLKPFDQTFDVIELVHLPVPHIVMPTQLPKIQTDQFNYNLKDDAFPVHEVHVDGINKLIVNRETRQVELYISPSSKELIQSYRREPIFVRCCGDSIELLQKHLDTIRPPQYNLVVLFGKASILEECHNHLRSDTLKIVYITIEEDVQGIIYQLMKVFAEHMKFKSYFVTHDRVQQYLGPLLLNYPQPFEHIFETTLTFVKQSTHFDKEKLNTFIQQPNLEGYDPKLLFELSLLRDKDMSCLLDFCRKDYNFNMLKRIAKENDEMNETIHMLDIYRRVAVCSLRDLDKHPQEWDEQYSVKDIKHRLTKSMSNVHYIILEACKGTHFVEPEFFFNRNDPPSKDSKVKLSGKTKLTKWQDAFKREGFNDGLDTGYKYSEFIFGTKLLLNGRIVIESHVTSFKNKSPTKTRRKSSDGDSPEPKRLKKAAGQSSESRQQMSNGIEHVDTILNFFPTIDPNDHGSME